MKQLSFDDLPEPEPERWLPVIGYEGLYDVSDWGRIRSLPRRTTRGGLMKLIADGKGYWVVSLTREGKQRRFFVHRLVMEAFTGPLPEGMEIRHLDGDPGNNRLPNLRYGTHSENMQDTIRHGTNRNAAKTHCPRGHEYTPQNTLLLKSGSRVCRACFRERSRENQRAYKQRLAEGPPRVLTPEELEKRRTYFRNKRREYRAKQKQERGGR